MQGFPEQFLNELKEKGWGGEWGTTNRNASRSYITEPVQGLCLPGKLEIDQ